MPSENQNGIILSYTVTYKALPGGSPLTKEVNAQANETTLTGLNEYTNYSITVLASTSKGVGNASKPIIVITDEDGKLQLFCKKNHNFYCRRQEVPAILNLQDVITHASHVCSHYCVFVWTSTKNVWNTPNAL